MSIQLHKMWGKIATIRWYNTYFSGLYEELAIVYPTTLRNIVSLLYQLTSRTALASKHEISSIFTISSQIYVMERQTAEQSSMLAEGNLCFHALDASSTTALAASSALSTHPTIDTTSSLLNTSHTCPIHRSKLEHEYHTNIIIYPQGGYIRASYDQEITPSLAMIRNWSLLVRRRKVSSGVEIMP